MPALAGLDRPGRGVGRAKGRIGPAGLGADLSLRRGSGLQESGRRERAYGGNWANRPKREGGEKFSFFSFYFLESIFKSISKAILNQFEFG